MEECLRGCQSLSPQGAIEACVRSCAASETTSGNGAGANRIGNPALGPKLQEWLAGSDPGITFVKNFVPNLITLLLIGGSVIFFFMLLWGAIEWISSGGDKGRIESARGRITNALVGLFIMFAMFAIIRIVETFFGTDILTLDIDILKIQ